MASTAAAIDLQSIGLTFASRTGVPVVVLKDVSCRFEPGKVTALIGPSGCGKSTLLQIARGFLAPGEGRLRYLAADGSESARPPEMLEDTRQQEQDGRRLRHQPAHAGDVQVCGLGTEEEIGIEIDGCLETAGGVEADRDPGTTGLGVGVHAQPDAHVLIARQVDGSRGHRLERLFRLVAEHRGGVETDLRTLGRDRERGHRLALESDVVVERAVEVRVADAIDDDAVDRERPWLVDLHADQRADAHGGVGRRPEMEFVGRVRLALGADHAADGRWVHLLAIPLGWLYDDAYAAFSSM